MARMQTAAPVPGRNGTSPSQRHVPDLSQTRTCLHAPAAPVVRVQHAARPFRGAKAGRSTSQQAVMWAWSPASMKDLRRMRAKAPSCLQLF